MRYIVLIGNQFDTKQMEKALEVHKQIGSGDFITMAGWQKSCSVPALWEKQCAWLIAHGVEQRDIVRPTYMAWPGSMAVERHARAVSVFDQMLCTAFVTTDDFWSKGELFFVGSAELEELVMELAAFLKIPRIPAWERCEYHKTATALKPEAKEWSKKALQVIRGELRVWSKWIPRTQKSRQKKQWQWLEQNCI
jgi:hypothetical protein